MNRNNNNNTTTITTENDTPFPLSQERSTPTKKTMNLAVSNPTTSNTTPKHIYTPTFSGGFKSKIGKPMSAPQTTTQTDLEYRFNETIKALANEKRECHKWKKSALLFQHQSQSLSTELDHLQQVTVPELKDQVQHLSEQVQVLTDMYQEACEKSVQIWDQVQQDQRLIQEFDQLTTDAVNENEALRLWVMQLGGDPDQDLHTFNELKQHVSRSNDQLHQSS